MAFEVGSIVARIKLDATAFQKSIDQVKTRLGKITGKKIAISLDQTRLGKQLTQVRARLRGLNKAATVRLTLDRKSFLKSVTQSNKDIRKFATRLKTVVTNTIQRFRDKSIPLNLRTKEFRRKLDAQFKRLNALKKLAGSIKIGTKASALSGSTKSLTATQQSADRAKKAIERMTAAQRTLSRLLATTPGVAAFAELKLRIDAARKSSTALTVALWGMSQPLKLLRVAAGTAFSFIGNAFKNVGRGVRSFGANILNYALKPISLLQKSIFNLKNIILVVLAREAIQRAVQLDSVARGFDNLSASIGTTSTRLKRDLRQALRGTVSDFEIMKTANNAIILRVARTGEQLAELAKIARVLGRAVGRDPVAAFNDLATGIGRQSRLILDNLGIIINVGQAWDTYSAKVGKTVDQLGDFERRLAFQEAVLDQGRELMELLGDQTETLADQYGRLFASVKNALDFLIQGIVIPDIAIDLGDIITRNIGQIKAAGRFAGSVLRSVWKAVGESFSRFARLDGKRRIRDIVLVLRSVAVAAIIGLTETITVLIEFLFTEKVWAAISQLFALIGVRLIDALWLTVQRIIKVIPGVLGLLIEAVGAQKYIDEISKALTDPVVDDIKSELKTSAAGLNDAVNELIDKMVGVFERRGAEFKEGLRGTFLQPIGELPDRIKEASKKLSFESGLSPDVIGLERIPKSHPALKSVREFGDELLKMQEGLKSGAISAEKFFEAFERAKPAFANVANELPFLSEKQRKAYEPQIKKAVGSFMRTVDVAFDEAVADASADANPLNKLAKQLELGSGQFLISGGIYNDMIGTIIKAYEELANKVGEVHQELGIGFDTNAMADLTRWLSEANKEAKIEVQIAGVDQAIQEIARLSAEFDKRIKDIGPGLPAAERDREFGELRKLQDNLRETQISQQQGDLRRRTQLIGAEGDIGGAELRSAQIRLQDDLAIDKEQSKGLLSEEEIDRNQAAIKTKYEGLFRDIRKSAGIELVSGLGRDLFTGLGNSLTDAFLRGEKASKAFSAFTADIFKSSMTNIIGDIGAKLQETLASALEKIGGLSEGALGGIGKIAQGMLAIGAAVHQLSQRKGAESTIDDFGEGLVDESEAIRGVVAGPTTVAISRVGSQLKQALQSTEALLLRIAVAAEGGSGGGGTINQGSTAANPGLSYRLSGSSQY
jgi:hypothetical protein